MKFVDDFLDNITMYRLVLYFLIVLAGVGLIYSLFGVLSFDPINYIFSFTFILVASWITNLIFAKIFEAPTNIESFWISGLILGLIVAPPKNLHEVIFVAWAAVLAMTLKYIFAINKKHIFNPVAISVVLTAFTIGSSANWWIGNISMLPAVAIGGFLVVRKIRRWDLVLSFLITALLVIGPARSRGILTDSPLIFFAAIMITEPLTTPPTRILRIIYGALVGFLFAPQIHLGSLYTTPELALIIGNIFAYIVSPKYTLILKLKSKIRLTPDTFDFVFAGEKPIKFTPGQYMEFTFEHPNSDSRGNRRYFSLASSPTEPEIRLGIKIESPSSSYKRNLLTMTPNQKIAAGQLIGDFTLPRDPNKRLVFIAGGIGITPYRSMLKYLIDTNQRRDIVVIYSVKTADKFVYKDILTEAQNKLSIRTVYVETETQGHIDAVRMTKEISDFKDRTFYISGSHGVVAAFEDVLKTLKIPRRQIVTDYFPGFA
jgi:ferredoxin-NADP reductase/Na+-translocating ferredoxin:NAD+ oxidoreductase RnfD subunit